MSFQMIAAGLAILLMGIVGYLLLIPGEKTSRARVKREKPAKDEAPEKDWQAASLKLEKHIQELRKELEQSQKQERDLDREVALQKEKYAKLQDKLAQERDWQKREENDADKKIKEIQSLKAEIKKYEGELEAIQGQRLRLEREKREIKDALDGVTEERRKLDLELTKFKAENETFRKDLREYREQNAKLSEKKDAEIWVAKTDYEKLEVELRNKDKDLARLREQLKKEML